MAVNIKIKIKSQTGKEIETIALVNSGFRSDAPEVIIPLKVAEKLDINPQLIENARIEKYEIAGGEVLSCYSIPDAVWVKIITEDKETEEVKCICTIMSHEREVIISDKLASALKIAIEDVGEGIRRFRGEQKLRKSFPPQFWV